MARNACLLALLLAALLLPAAQAGTPDEPEVEDATGDAAGPFDLAAAWVTADGPDSVTLHARVAELAAPPAPTEACGPACAAASLSFRWEFRVLAPDASPAPAIEGYNGTYVVYRHGPANASLATAVGFYDGEGLTVNGTGTARVNGTEIAVTVARSHPAIAVPAGEAPGAYRIAGLFAYSSPQACSTAEAPELGPVGCVSPPLPVASVPPGTTSEWDRAPDSGPGADFVFPSPPPAAPQAPGEPAEEPAGSPPSSVPAASPTPTPTPAVSPQPQLEPAAAETHPEKKDAPAPGLAGLALLPALAWALRRRL